MPTNSTPIHALAQRWGRPRVPALRLLACRPPIEYTFPRRGPPSFQYRVLPSPAFWRDPCAGGPLPAKPLEFLSSIVCADIFAVPRSSRSSSGENTTKAVRLEHVRNLGKSCSPL